MLRRAMCTTLLLGALQATALFTGVDRLAAQGPPNGSTLVVIVRHAEKAALPADDPSISEAGQARAKALAEALTGANVTAVITSARRRTTETALPLAQARGLTPEVIALDTAHVRNVAAAVRKHSGGVVLVVGHSNTVPAIIAALGGPAMPDLCDGVYSSLFVLEISGSAKPASDGKPTARLVRGQYGAPDATGADQCRSMSPK